MDRVGTASRGQDRDVIQRFRHLLLPHVRGDFNDDRTAAAVTQRCEGPAKNVADFGCQYDRFNRFGDAAHGFSGIEVWGDVGKTARLTHGKHEDGHGFGIALGDAAERILGARAVLHAENPDGPARCDPRNTVRHMQTGAFLAHNDRADIGSRSALDDMVERVGAEDLDPLALQDFCDCIAKLHERPPVNISRTRGGVLFSQVNIDGLLKSRHPG
jgi:hypothetical protein